MTAKGGGAPPPYPPPQAGEGKSIYPPLLAGEGREGAAQAERKFLPGACRQAEDTEGGLPMTIKQTLLAATAVGFAMLAAGAPIAARAQQAPAVAAPAIDDDDIGGIVTSRMGPESGVWVVAETTELGTRFAKMAVTDDLGRFVVPDLPKATYRVWVRGYGLVDSPKVTA